MIRLIEGSACSAAKKSLRALPAARYCRWSLATDSVLESDAHVCTLMQLLCRHVHPLDVPSAIGAFRFTQFLSIAAYQGSNTERFLRTLCTSMPVHAHTKEEKPHLALPHLCRAGITWLPLLLAAVASTLVRKQERRHGSRLCRLTCCATRS